MENRCDICGKEIREEDSLELLDGCLCRECAGKLSPWFRDPDCAEVEEIQEQLRQREDNRKALSRFHPTRKFGCSTLVVVDDNARSFLVTDDSNLRRKNPEIISLDDVIDCSLEIEEDREKLGNRQYLYSYRFRIQIDLDHSYLDEITFLLNDQPLEYESSEKSFLGFGGFDPEEKPEYQDLQKLGQKIEAVLGDMEDGEDQSHVYDVVPGEFLLGETESAESGSVMTCPWCGCRTRVTEEFRCQHCGGNL